jgi:hypothetical protein
MVPFLGKPWWGKNGDWGRRRTMNGMSKKESQEGGTPRSQRRGFAWDKRRKRKRGRKAKKPWSGGDPCPELKRKQRRRLARRRLILPLRWRRWFL